MSTKRCVHWPNAAKRVGDARNWPETWLNDAVKRGHLAGSCTRSLRPLLPDRGHCGEGNAPAAGALRRTRLTAGGIEVDILADGALDQTDELLDGVGVPVGVG